MEFKKRDELFKGRRVIVVGDTYEKPNGNLVTYEIVKVKHAVAILGETSDGKFVFIKESRPAVGKMELTEIPAGLIEEGETPVEAGIREFLEETGIEVKNVEYWAPYYTSCGFTDEVIHICYTNDLGTFGQQSLDENEDIEVFLVDKEEAFAMLESKEPLNGALLMALLYYKAFKS